MTLEAKDATDATFSWRADEEGDELSISFFGELDIATIEECKASLEEPLRGPQRVILFDLGALAFADTTALGFFLGVKRYADGAGKRIVITRVSAAVMRLFDASGMTSWFEFSDGAATEDLPA